MTGLQGGYHRAARSARLPGSPVAPSCPPYWLISSRKSSDLWSPTARPRSHSMSSTDTRRRHHRNVRFVLCDSEDEAGYSEDDEASSTDDNIRSHRSQSGGRPRSTAPKHPHPSKSQSVRVHVRPRTASASSAQNCRQSSLDSGPLCHDQRPCKKRISLSSMGRKLGAGTQLHCPSPPSRPQQQRPSSAGPVVKNHRQKVSKPSLIQ